MQIDREGFLQAIEAVSAGLAVKEVVEQSNCLVFTDDDQLVTFNDQVACRMASPLPGVVGAVGAKALQELLTKLPEDTLNVEVNGKALRIRGKRRRASFNMQAEVVLPVGSVDKPDEWKDLDPEFGDAVSVVQSCASTNPQANFSLTCVHMHPDYLEACDNFQAIRYPMKLPLERECVVKQSSIKHVPNLSMTQMAQSKNWLHFRNDVGLVLSLRYWNETYDNLDGILTVEGSPALLPGGLSEAVDKANVFSSENADQNRVLVRVRDGELALKGIGVSGWYEEKKQLEYDGADLEFRIDPALLAEISGRTNECVLSGERLKVDGGRFVYVTALASVNSTA